MLDGMARTIQRKQNMQRYETEVTGGDWTENFPCSVCEKNSNQSWSVTSDISEWLRVRTYNIPIRAIRDCREVF